MLHPYQYQRQDSPQTLASGLEEYYRAHPQLVRGPALSPDAAGFFRCHDTVHVLYGCGTALEDEAVVKLASIVGTTAGFGVLRGYALHESREIYRQLAPREVLSTVVRSAYLVPQTFWRCLRQQRRWPWDGLERHAREPLQHLRQLYGIRVAHEA